MVDECRYEYDECPVWIGGIIDEVSEAMFPDQPTGDLGYCWNDPEETGDRWELHIFPTLNEIRGGANDGATFLAGFSLCVNAVMVLFDTLPHVHWFAPATYEGELDGPNVTITGEVHGIPLRLAIYSEPPPAFEVTYVYDTLANTTRPKRGLEDE